MPPRRQKEEIPHESDLVFIGHVTLNDIETPGDSTRGAPGGAPFFGDFGAACSGKRIAVGTRMPEEDGHVLEPLKKWGQ